MFILQILNLIQGQNLIVVPRPIPSNIAIMGRVIGGQGQVPPQSNIAIMGRVIGQGPVPPQSNIAIMGRLFGN